jgi:hypothetical protein
MGVEFDEFKGNKMIKLFADNDEEKKYPFMFGKSKAKLIIQNYDEIKKFADGK